MNSVLFLGSNVGDRAKFLARARQHIKRWPKTKITGQSPVLKTAPEGYIKQRAFFNQALRIETRLKPMALLIWAKVTEAALGRKLRFRWGPREIDIDIMTYGRMRLKTPMLTLPHPRLAGSASMKLALKELRR